MSIRHRQDFSSRDGRRPPIAGAPEWFNRARATANQRQVFHPRPIPFVQIPEAEAAVTSSSRLRDGRWILGLALVAVPLVFCAGYCTRGMLKAAERPSASGRLTRAVARTRPENHKAVRRAKAPVHLSVNSPAAGAPSEADGGRLSAQSVPARSSAPRGMDRHQSPAIQIVAASGSTESPPASPAGASETSDGFSLKTPGLVRQISAEVVKPVNAWFDVTADAADCTTGTCAAPIRGALDRKLNTALEWSPTPEAAAAAAERDGKLVFLIHVSGNFAQQGFT